MCCTQRLHRGLLMQQQQHRRHAQGAWLGQVGMRGRGSAACPACQLGLELRQLGRSHSSSPSQLAPAPTLLGGEFEG